VSGCSALMRLTLANLCPAGDQKSIFGGRCKSAHTELKRPLAVWPAASGLKIDLEMKRYSAPAPAKLSTICGVVESKIGSEVRNRSQVGATKLFTAAAVVLHPIDGIIDRLHGGRGALDGNAVRRDADAMLVGQLLGPGGNIALWRPNGCAPKLLDLGECGAVVFVGTDRADLHGGPHQNLATARALMASYSACVPTNFANAICQRKSNAAISR
jgi:hypothetical protein